MAMIVLANGCFDIFHYGHLAHLEAASEIARNAGARLVIALTSDRFVNKGPGRPVFNQEQRALLLRALRIVDHVVISDAPSPAAIIQEYQPAIYVKGKEYEGRLPEQELVESYGGRVVFTDTIIFSSTKLLGWL
jgi:rfaE bifunctional protein nucleotidyltransferase chain/domain